MHYELPGRLALIRVVEHYLGKIVEQVKKAKETVI
jgi:hypothetical protein